MQDAVQHPAPSIFILSRKLKKLLYVKLFKYFKTYSAEFVTIFFMCGRKEIVLTILYKNQQSFFL
jgi:hypothetical protein